ncbi:exopolysaccharide biosynthesis polyprenyl glycosylphosphotransferase [Pontibacter flavimaris]|uniref:Exopolysaccharide biosynthesis polyprenyl glycosylphosphotransferase n=1 Tax=Pontibacter flavimaris TaxID=1797110 RepID=A0A1Q5PBG9_9BACT|nr:exopolysaccharide biosynthesis polyprenyl glycosylphosphotransferase [Pontibacter flavimaris]OKL39553.1 exopolysaccharide biosynthesis polyprenyl glycosylphosphotransferase [Pontibacter flavimaris]
MIRARQKSSSSSWEKDVLTAVLTITILFSIADIVAFVETHWLVIINIFLLWILIGYTRTKSTIGMPDSRHIPRLTNFIKTYLVLLCLTSMLYYLNPELLNIIFTDKKVFAAFALGFPILGIPLNFMVGGVMDQIKSNTVQGRHTLIAGVGSLAKHVEEEVCDHKVKGFLTFKKEEECLVNQDKIVGGVDGIQEYLEHNMVDEIVIAIPVKHSKKIRNILSVADHYGVRVKYVPDYQSVFGEHFRTKRYGNLEAVHVRQLPLDNTYASFLKSAFDILFSTLALLALLPLFLILAVLIKLDSPGPIFYCPIRIGKGGKPLRVYKFRTMAVCDDVFGGIMSTQKNDPRITSLGHFMRKYSLDELPQFLNVLSGEMSVVGPRPHRSFLNRQLQESEDKYMIRHYYKPGITGWAQVNGWRGPTDTKEQKSQRTLHDIWYMENWSFVLDLRIVYMTIFGRNTHKTAF